MSEMHVDVQPTPNPNAIKFTVDRPTTDGRPHTYRTADEAADNKVAAALLAIDGVVNVFMTANFISVNKTDAADWNDIVPAAVEAIQGGYAV